ncbi:MAG: alpha/beta hydrolase [Deltaproteobacteria bacterium]|nr:alpha/beta hydrolase [Deltaproteobacteria bacterium]MBW2049924.1 alpha/beta hydrolase [Deltaproteobacteria bacterium]MBW2353866.1 alpha/beta hydrolase [Deltaproteobacteria bacterium]
MIEKQVFFDAGGLKIEALVAEGKTDAGVVVTHPHPLYGGDMHNNVVEALVQAYQEKGFTTLRFNFRGVGRSEGAFDEGKGEQEDVRAAVEYLRGLGKTRVDLSGYSFGAWVNARSIENLSPVRRMIMVSPPVNFLDFSFLKTTVRLRLVVTGSNDDIAPPDMIREMIASWNPDAEFRIVAGADHFYWDRTGEIEAMVKDLLERENGEHPSSLE